ncbi:MAG TPA: GYD domain-containing protein [Methylomirabilota bacterium]|nr:GYD domain-containing protein [Methylomirabilota bacterium]
MAVYIMLSKLTSLGRRTIKSNPKRIQEVNREVESYGARVTAQYATLGPYDFVSIVEAPDNKTIAKVSVELGSRGTILLTTLPALPLKEFVTTIRKK